MNCLNSLPISRYCPLTLISINIDKCAHGINTLWLFYIVMSCWTSSVGNKLSCCQLTTTEPILLKHDVASCYASMRFDDILKKNNIFYCIFSEIPIFYLNETIKSVGQYFTCCSMLGEQWWGGAHTDLTGLTTQQSFFSINQTICFLNQHIVSDSLKTLSSNRRKNIQPS